MQVEDYESNNTNKEEQALKAGGGGWVKERQPYSKVGFFAFFFVLFVSFVFKSLLAEVDRG
jgi:hypothetical protein